jgi:hypothetical protein
MPIGSAVLNRALQKIGSWININIGSENFNEYGDGSVFFTAFSGEGYIFHRSEMDTSMSFGMLNEADAMGYFTMASNFPVGSKIEITYRGTNFETLGEAITPQFSGADLIQIVNLRKKVN